MSEEFQNYRALEPGEQLIDGDQFRWEGEWRCVYRQCEYYPKYVTRGIRHRRPISPSEAKMRSELTADQAPIAIRDSRIAELESINERLHNDIGSWRRDHASANKERDAVRDDLIAARTQLAQRDAEIARMREALQQAKNTLYDYMPRDGSMVDKALIQIESGLTSAHDDSKPPVLAATLESETISGSHGFSDVVERSFAIRLEKLLKADLATERAAKVKAIEERDALKQALLLADYYTCVDIGRGPADPEWIRMRSVIESLVAKVKGEAE